MKDVIRVCSGPIATNTYLVSVNETEIFVVDPGGDFFEINAAIEELHKIPVVVVLTHAHPDHVGALKDLKNAYPQIQIMAHCKEKHLYGQGSLRAHVRELPDLAPFILSSDVPALDKILNDGDYVLDKWKVIHTPGHSVGSICLYNAEKNILFTGDTYFAPYCYGRTDLSGGSETELLESLKKLEPYIQEAKYIFPGH